MANATSDLKEQIDFLRQRVTELEKENAEIRKLIRGA
jgi:prefoldin subunit 5